MEGWGVFHFIVNEIYRVEGCYMVMDADGLFDISDYSRMDEKRFRTSSTTAPNWAFSTKNCGRTNRF